MLPRHFHRHGRRHIFLIKCFIIGLLIFIYMNIPSTYLDEDSQLQVEQIIEFGYENYRTKASLLTLDHLRQRLGFTYERFTQWNRTLCSSASDRHGPHQKVIALSIYEIASSFSNNTMFSWNTSIIPFFEALVNEANTLLPSWTIRVYVDFTGSTISQRDFIFNFSNVDVCDMNDIPLFGSSLLTYLPGRLRRFLPIFDPYVDYVICNGLDSPITVRETETIDLWMSEEHKENFFYIARDHDSHSVPILGGLWGAATVRARQRLFDIFRLLLIPSVSSRYVGAGDRQFLIDFVWDQVKNHSTIFDSFFCETLGGRPFLSQRPKDICFLGCTRPCCTNTTETDYSQYIKPCPIQCRPKDHQDWTHC